MALILSLEMRKATRSRAAAGAAICGRSTKSQGNAGCSRRVKYYLRQLLPSLGLDPRDPAVPLPDFGGDGQVAFPDLANGILIVRGLDPLGLADASGSIEPIMPVRWHDAFPLGAYNIA
jgi:hypothetical protein